MRPLFYEDTNAELNENSSSYLWGKDFLVTPILKDSITTIEVTFPSGGNWFDFYDGTKIRGGQTKSITVSEDYIPTYVRGGAFVVLTDVVQTTSNYSSNDWNVHYYYDETVNESERVYYNDDGKLAGAYQKGAYERIEFEAETGRKWLEIDFEAEQGLNWTATTKNINLILHHIDWTPKRIKVNGKSVSFGKKERELTIPVVWNTQKEMKIKVSLRP
jgi:alpha-glucosidase (family GH31 glycosyl hydrolase)